MLSDKVKNVCQLALNKVQFLRGNVPSDSFINQSEKSGSSANPDVQLSIRQFVLSELNLKAKSCYELVNLNAKDFEKISR